MLIFDQLKKNDPQLRVLTLMVMAGLGVLLAGLWWVQIVSRRDYQANLENQSFRTVRIPAVRGRILDRNHTVLAENQPGYNVSLYLEELRTQFQTEYNRLRPFKLVTNHGFSSWFRSSPVKTQYVRLKKGQVETLKWEARYRVASNVVAQVSQRLQQPLVLDRTNFQRHYETRLALPLQILSNATPVQIARFQEQSTSLLGLDLEVQTSRVYPHNTIAAHVLGHLKRNDDSVEGEESYFSYWLPDYCGVLGIEYGYDKQLRGMAGAKSVLVNNVGYRQTENIWRPAEPGQNVVLTIDLAIQQAAEEALPVYGPTTRGAAVVMDVNTGDILAMASSPTLNPNAFTRGFGPGEYQRILSLQAERNRAMEGYAPGSTFKVVVGLAALEAGLNPKQEFNIDADPANPTRGIIYVGRRPFHDTARPGKHDFRSALKLSSNSYFIMNGLRIGPERIVQMGQRLHLGELSDLPTHQGNRGAFPSLQRLRSGWRDGNTANMCIGQDPVLVTPLQMAVVTAAIANGGKVLWPRLVDRLEPLDPASGEPPMVFPQRPPRDHLDLKRPSTLAAMHEAMLADVEDSDGTGKSSAVEGLRVCGKTGTAQIKNAQGQLTHYNVWFISYAPYESPRYAVVVMVETETPHGSGGTICAPIAHKIYSAIVEQERKAAAKAGSLALAK